MILVGFLQKLVSGAFADVPKQVGPLITWFPGHGLSFNPCVLCGLIVYTTLCYCSPVRVKSSSLRAALTALLVRLRLPSPLFLREQGLRYGSQTCHLQAVSAHWRRARESPTTLRQVFARIARTAILSYADVSKGGRWANCVSTPTDGERPRREAQTSQDAGTQRHLLRRRYPRAPS